MVIQVLGDEDNTISALRKYFSDKRIPTTLISKQDKFLITSFVADPSRPADRTARRASILMGINQDTQHRSPVCTTINLSTIIQQRGIHEEAWASVSDDVASEPLVLQTLRNFA
jgi:hypothetical protein